MFSLLTTSSRHIGRTLAQLVAWSMLVPSAQAQSAAVAAMRANTGADTGADTLPRAERLRIVDAMDAFTRKHFAHWRALGPQSYDSMVTVFRTAVNNADNRRTFDMAALAFTAGLRNGHTRFSDRWLNQTYGQPLWLWIWPQSNGWLVTSTEFSGLVKGDVITHVNEAPVNVVYAQARPYLIESGERLRRYGVTQADYLWPLTSQLTLVDGRTVSITRGCRPTLR